VHALFYERQCLFVYSNTIVTVCLYRYKFSGSSCAFTTSIYTYIYDYITYVCTCINKPNANAIRIHPLLLSPNNGGLGTGHIIITTTTTTVVTDTIYYAAMRAHAIRATNNTTTTKKNLFFSHTCV
jgi:hypothetical protein